MSFRHHAGSGSVWLADRTLPSNPSVFDVVVSAMHLANDHAYVLISAAPGAVARLAERLPALSGVVDVTALLGPHDALASVAVAPPGRIRDVVARIAATEGVVDVVPAYLLSAAAAAA